MYNNRNVNSDFAEYYNHNCDKYVWLYQNGNSKIVNFLYVLEIKKVEKTQKNLTSEQLLTNLCPSYDSFLIKNNLPYKIIPEI